MRKHYYLWDQIVFNSLENGVEFTTKVVGDFEDEWGLPTLDTLWKMIGGMGGRNRICYSFYKNPVSSDWVTPFRSARDSMER